MRKRRGKVTSVVLGIVCLFTLFSSATRQSSLEAEIDESYATFAREYEFLAGQYFNNSPGQDPRLTARHMFIRRGSLLNTLRREISVAAGVADQTPTVDSRLFQFAHIDDS
jgi:hypothetical protein